MTSRVSKPRVPVMTCPHCNSRAYARSCKTFSPLYREVNFLCENDACQHRFVAGTTILRTTTASFCPNPAIYLPVMSQPVPANDDAPVIPPEAANDIDPATTMTDTA